MKLFVVSCANGKRITTTLLQAKKFAVKQIGKVGEWKLVNGKHCYVTIYVPGVTGIETLAVVESVQCI